MNIKTLSFQSSGLLQELNKENSTFFTLDQAYQLLPDSNKPAVRRVLSDMTDRGLLLRLKNGLYCIIPYDQDASTYFPNPHLIARHLATGANFYIGYYSAMEIHSLITQPALQEQIVVDKQIKPSALKIKGHKFQFIYHNKDHFFGIKSVWIDSFNKVPCSDLEKTFIDCKTVRSYSTGINKTSKAIDNDFGDLIIADFNFDNREDFAVKNDSGGNGGPTYNFYIQDKNKNFTIDKFLTTQMEFFPSKFITKSKRLVTYVHANAYQLSENIFEYNEKLKKWKYKESRLISPTSETKE